MARRGVKQCLLVDEAEGPWYDAIGAVAFSADGRKLAYVAGDKGRWFVVTDGVKGPEFDGLGKGTLRISKDGSSTAYIAPRNGKYVVVVNGVEGKEYDGIGQGTLTFLADSGHFAYVGIESSGIQLRDGGLLGAYHIVVGGEERWTYPGFAEDSFGVSPDGLKFFCAVPRDHNWYAVLNGRELSSCDAFIGRPFFEGSDSVRYVVKKEHSIFSVRAN